MTTSNIKLLLAMLDELTWTLTVYSAGFGSAPAQANAEASSTIASAIFFTISLLSACGDSQYIPSGSGWNF
jgi:hypothetical protein